MKAQYLLRFDDICPTMNWCVWREVEEVLSDSGVRPILAVIPDNQDEKLKVSQPNSRFWDEVRRWQSSGWTIGLHGYQHRYVTHDSGLMGINAYSEFSGLSYDEQRSKLSQALDVLEREGIAPAVWIAPAHSFDVVTLNALCGLGIRHISDGFFLYPCFDSLGMMWVPQQLWRFRKMPFGLWTVCLHVNQWGKAEVARFRSDLHRFAGALTDWPSVISSYAARKPNISDSVFGNAYRIVLRGRGWFRRSLRLNSP